MDTVTRMEGFNDLLPSQMKSVLNNPDNFIGLSATANKSKGVKSFADWTSYKKAGIDVDPAFRQQMMGEEAKIAPQLQQQIDSFNK